MYVCEWLMPDDGALRNMLRAYCTAATSISFAARFQSFPILYSLYFLYFSLTSLLTQDEQYIVSLILATGYSIFGSFFARIN